MRWRRSGRAAGAREEPPGRAAARRRVAFLAALLGAAAIASTGGEAATGELPAFPADQGLALVSASPPSLVGAPAVVLAVETDTGQRFGELRNLLQSWVTVERVARDDGRGRIPVVKVAPLDVAPGCRYFASLLAPVLRQPFLDQCLKLQGVDLSIYASIDYRLASGFVGGGERSFRPNTKDGGEFDEDEPKNRAPRRDVGPLSFEEQLLRKAKPGNYELRVRTVIGFKAHPVLSPILALKELYDDWLAQPFEIAEGPAAWAVQQLVDAVVEDVVEQARAKALDTTAVYRFAVPAIVPALDGLKPFEARARLHALNLRVTLIKEVRRGPSRVGRVIRQSPRGGALVAAGTKVRVRYVVYSPTAPAPGAPPSPPPPAQPPPVTFPTAASCPDGLVMTTAGGDQPVVLGSFSRQTTTYAGFQCLYVHPSDPADEWFVLLIGVAPPNVPGVVASGACGQTPTPGYTGVLGSILLSSVERYLNVAGGPRKFDVDAKGGTPAFWQKALTLAESQGVGAPCP